MLYPGAWFADQPTAGAMDPGGREEAELARRRGLQGLLLSAMAPYTALALWAVLVTVVGLVLSLLR